MGTQKQSSLGIQRKKANRKSRDEDICPVCRFDLYYTERRSKRIGLIDENDDIIGWICPKCKTEFDLENLVVMLFRDEPIRGEA